MDRDYGAVIVSGSNLQIDPASLASHWEGLGRARVLVLQNEIPEAVNLAAAAAARAAGAIVILNAAPARPMSEDLLGSVDILVVNRVEATMLAGCEVSNHESALAALKGLAAPGRSVIFTLGGSGVVVKPAGAPPVFLPPKVVEVVSTHGAGDCFIGVLAARIAMGTPIEQAARFANDAAADFVSTRH